jgi:hypothetical protein
VASGDNCRKPGGKLCLPRVRIGGAIGDISEPARSVRKDWISTPEGWAALARDRRREGSVRLEPALLVAHYPGGFCGTGVLAIGTPFPRPG